MRLFTVKQKQYADKSPCMLLVSVLSLFRFSVFSQCPWSVFPLPWCLYATCSLRPVVSATLLEILVISTLPQVQSGHQDADVHTHTHNVGKRETRDINTMHKHGILPTEDCRLWHIQSNTDFHQLSYIGTLFLTFSLHNPVNHKKLIIYYFIKSYISKSKFA